MHSNDPDGGFTLIELMVAIACITVLSAIAVPRLQGYVLEARLNGAKPYLMEIAARQRMYKLETGRYCCTSSSGFAENTLVSSLSSSARDAGDFCFMFVCKDTALCESTTSVNYIDASGGKPDFEVWALLRPAGVTTVAGYGGATCTVATDKAAATGWVRSAAAVAGRTGQAVVLRYPPPANGIAAVSGNHRTTVRMDWRDGVSLTDALLP